MSEKVRYLRVREYTCNLCGHSWYPRKKGRPHFCARCHSSRHDEPNPKGATNGHESASDN